MRRVVLGAMLMSLVGCNLPQDRTPSILVVAIEGLGFDSVSCDGEEIGQADFDGLKVVCDEAVRFSHAFTPSTMSQATLSSIMTGLYPLEHMVRHNGRDFLSAKFQTAAEVALERNFHTAFISGGAPIWRKSGLAQGFEVFDDPLNISKNNLYRPAQEVFRIGRHWIQSMAADSPFFLTLFLADLQFPDSETFNNAGELRPLGRDSQVGEVMESLGSFITWLKRSKRWHSTHLVLVGTNGFSNQGAQPDVLDLRSASTQVALFIKPARREKDNVIQWAVDRNMSLVDVGRTILSWLGKQNSDSILPWASVDLNQVLRHPEPNWSENRLILTETGWPSWTAGLGIRWSIRQGQFLYVHDAKPLIYNTLTDRLEMSSLRSNDPLWLSLNHDILNLVGEMNLEPFSGMSENPLVQIKVAQDVWHAEGLGYPKSGSEPWAYWYLRMALRDGNWIEVKRLAEKMSDSVGDYVASVHLGETVAPPKTPCIQMLQSRGQEARAFCHDEKLLALADWREAKTVEGKLMAQDRFNRSYLLFKLDQEVGWMNYLNSARWHVRRDLPGSPHAVEYLLTIPPFSSLAKNLSL